MNFKLVRRTLTVAGLAMILTLGLSTISNAEEVNKIATVDARKVYDNWDVKKGIDKEFDPLRKSLKDQEAEINAAIKNLSQKSSGMPEAKVIAEKARIDDLKTKFSKTYTETVEKIDKKAQELSTQMDDLLQKAYEEIVKNDGYTLILDSRSVRYAGKNVKDITDDVTAFVNSHSKTEDAPPAPKKKN